jgi:hypothetical protein
VGVETYIRDQAARAQLYVFKSGLGQQGTYRNRSGSNVTVWCDAEAETKTLVEQNGVEIELSTRVVHVPRQTNFPPTDGVAINDEFTLNSIKYYIDDFEKDALEATWKLTVQRQQARTLKGR